MHHGAGYTSQTWLQLINLLKESLPSSFIVFFDMRGHGKSSSTNESVDFSLDTLVNDAGKVLRAVLGHVNENIEVFLIGHSLGASVLAALPHKVDIPKVKYSGLVMIDIIEGKNQAAKRNFFMFVETAVQALTRMSSVIADIPKSFKDIESATKWTISSSHSHHKAQAASKRIDAIEKSVSSQLFYNDVSGSFEWITDLSKMSSYWDTWFTSLTSNFLRFPGSRLLILATDTDYMDRDMTIAQMQGKFQLVVVRESGHAVQEDKPEEMAEPLISMIQKHLKLTKILCNKQ